MPASINDYVVPFSAVVTLGGVDLGALPREIKLKLKMKRVEFGRTQNDHGIAKMVQAAQDIEVQFDSDSAVLASLQRAMGMIGDITTGGDGEELDIQANERHSEGALPLALTMALGNIRGVGWPVEMQLAITNMVPSQETLEILWGVNKNVKAPLTFVSTEGWSLSGQERILVPSTFILRGNAAADLTADVQGRAWSFDGGDTSVSIDDSVKKFGAGAYSFGPSSSDSCFLEAAASTDFALGTQDFSMGGWIKFDDLGSKSANIHHSYESGDGRLELYLNTSNQLKFEVYYNTGSSSQVKAMYSYTWAGLATGTWYHLAVVRHGADLLLFIDGIQTTWTTITTAITALTSLNLSNLGTSYSWRLGHSNVGAGNLTGWMDDVFLTIGTALWTGTFDPPYTELEAA